MNEDNTNFTLTIWGCLAAVMADYDINFDHITPKMGKHMGDDLMELLEKSGYLERVEE